ncbi:MAG: hypothetical protein RLY30_1646 [Pseudomonadota bacterium]|jgi:hypothetical protein
MKVLFMNLLASMWVCVLGLSSAVAVAAEPHGHSGGHRHVHGEADVEITLDAQGRLSGHLQAAMDAFLPFEHAPKTEAQRRQLSQLQESLQQVGFLLSANPEAGCTQTSVQADSALFHAKAFSGHANLEVKFTLQCAHPSALRQLSFDILRRSGRLKKIELEFVGPNTQAKAVLTSKRPAYTLP